MPTSWRTPDDARWRSSASRSSRPSRPALGRLLVEWQGVATTVSTREQAGGPDRLAGRGRAASGRGRPGQRAGDGRPAGPPAALPPARPGPALRGRRGRLGRGRAARGARRQDCALPDRRSAAAPDAGPSRPAGRRLSPAAAGRISRATAPASLRSFTRQRAVARSGWCWMRSGIWSGPARSPTTAWPRCARTCPARRPSGRWVGGATGRSARGGRPHRARSGAGAWSSPDDVAHRPVSRRRTPLPSARREAGPTSTQRARAIAEQLVARHGILTRQAVLAEGVPGGSRRSIRSWPRWRRPASFRRGYFLAGLGGAQFAQAGRRRSAAVAARERGAGRSGPACRPSCSAATDPANPYGAALPWPTPAVASAPKPMRSAGARVILVDGALAAFVRGDRDVATFLPEDEPARSAVGRAAARAVARWAVGTGRVHLGWATVDGVPAARSPFGSYLEGPASPRARPVSVCSPPATGVTSTTRTCWGAG